MIKLIAWKNTNSSRCDNISNKAIKHIKYLLSEPLTLSIIQSLINGECFYDNLKMTLCALPTIDLHRHYQSSQKYLKRQYISNFWIILQTQSYCAVVNVDFTHIIQHTALYFHCHDDILKRLYSNNTLFTFFRFI